MTGLTEQTGRTLTGSVTMVMLVPAALLCLVAVPQSAAEDLPTSSDQPGERITSNQGVALDMGNAPTESGAAEDVESVLHGGGASGRGDRPQDASSASRLIKARRLDVDPAPLGGESTPWYRTGLGALAIVLAVVALAYYLVRRLVPGVGVSEGGVLHVVSRVALTPKHSATLVQLGRRFILIGVAPDRVDLLCEVTEPEEVAELAARTAGRRTGGSRSFDRLLAGESEAFSTEREEGEGPLRPLPPPPRDSQPISDLLDKLRHLKSRSA